MAEKEARLGGSMSRPFVKVIIVVLIVTAFTVVLEHVGWLRGFERAALDTWLRARLHLFAPTESPLITVVGIDDRDYREIFSAQSPLDVEGLQQIINAVAAARPAVLAVDIDTAEEQFKDLRPPAVPVVWAEDALIPEDGELNVQPLGVLGGAHPPPPQTGIAKLPLESDGVVRTYNRYIGHHRSFPWAVAQTFCARLNEDEAARARLGDTLEKVARRCGEIAGAGDSSHGEHEEYALDLLGDRHRFRHLSARDVLDPFVQNDSGKMPDLSGQIVILGGVFYAGRDEYTTALGRMAGADLMAHAVESEVGGGGVRRPKEFIMLVLNIIGGVGIVLLFIKLGLTRGCLLSVLLIFVVAPLWSLLAFRSFAYTTYFLPILFAVLIHQLYEQAHYYQHRALHEYGHDPAAESPPAAPVGGGDS